MLWCAFFLWNDAPDPEGDACDCGEDGEGACDGEQRGVEVVAILVVHGVEHPEEVEGAPVVIAAGGDLGCLGVDVDVRVLWVVEFDLVGGEGGFSVFGWD